MSPESMISYLKEETINNCLFGINECPIPVIVEFSSGEELPIEKAYYVGGRASAIKILINDYELQNLREGLENVQTERDEAQEEVGRLEKELNEKEDYEELKDQSETLERVEDAVTLFFSETGTKPLYHDDASNIDYLREKYIDQRNQIEELEEEIACLRVDNRALADTLEKVLPKED